MDQISAIKSKVKKFLWPDRKVYAASIDLGKAFDRVNREGLDIKFEGCVFYFWCWRAPPGSC